MVSRRCRRRDSERARALARLDTGGPVRDLLLAIFSWVAKQERRRLAERTCAGMQHARANGTTSGKPICRPRRLRRADTERARSMRAQGRDPCELSPWPGGPSVDGGPCPGVAEQRPCGALTNGGTPGVSAGNRAYPQTLGITQPARWHASRQCCPRCPRLLARNVRVPRPRLCSTPWRATSSRLSLLTRAIRTKRRSRATSRTSFAAI
jgi:hypothetical protein